MTTPAPLQTGHGAAANAARYDNDEGEAGGAPSSEGAGSMSRLPASTSGTAGPGGANTAAMTSTGAALGNIDISSPHELTDWVDRVLEQLESRFDGMNEQFVKRMKEMSERIDALETSIEDLIVGATAPVPAEK